jgi:hypothetical protein
MAVARDTISQATTFSGASNASWTHTPTPSLSNPVAIVSVAYANLSSTITCTATYDGVAMVSIGQVKNTSFDSAVTGYVDYFQLTGIPTGSGKTVAITFSAGGNVGDAFCVTYSDVSQGTPCGTLVTNTGTGSPTTVVVSITSGNMGTNTLCGDATFGTATGNKTSIYSLDNNYTAAAQDTTDSGSVSFEYTFTPSVNWAASGVEILASSGGGGNNSLAWIRA